MQIVTVLLECKVEGDRTGDVPEMELKQMVKAPSGLLTARCDDQQQMKSDPSFHPQLGFQYSAQLGEGRDRLLSTNKPRTGHARPRAL